MTVVLENVPDGAPQGVGDGVGVGVGGRSSVFPVKQKTSEPPPGSVSMIAHTLYVPVTITPNSNWKFAEAPAAIGVARDNDEL
jgi:hypothetical protein